MFRFKLLAGRHHQGGKTYQTGDVFDSNYDLRKMNAPGAKKFELIGLVKPTRPVMAATQLTAEQATQPQLVQPTEEEVIEPVADEEDLDDGLESLTVEGLKELAEAEEIDLGKATRKADIIEAIRVARAG